jgi:cytoplasmic iron level regulating protein YaaA (DUF328/UPF0246 family)
MLVLLPPSEGKAEPTSGDPIDLSSLAFPELTKQRERLIRGVDRALFDAPAAPAAEIYTGVLFAQLRLPELGAEAQSKAFIASALWGVVRPDDRIPSYSLNMSGKVRRLKGGLAAFWRPPLARHLPDEGLILDLRSGTYAAAWQPQRATVVTVRGFTEAKDGSRTVVTHMVKRIRGDVARIALEAGDAETPEEIAELAGAAGLNVEFDPATNTLDVIERATDSKPTD